LLQNEQRGSRFLKNCRKGSRRFIHMGLRSATTVAREAYHPGLLTQTPLQSYSKNVPQLL
jgi:hypothetical protein